MLYGGVFHRHPDLTVVLEEMGRRLLCAPYFATVVLAANNSYGGNSFVQTGTLQVGSGGLTGTLGTAGTVTGVRVRSPGGSHPDPFEEACRRASVLLERSGV